MFKTPITNINKTNDEMSALWKTSHHTIDEWAIKFHIANASDFSLTPKELEEDESFTALAKTYKSPLKVSTDAITGFAPFYLQISPYKRKLVDADDFVSKKYASKEATTLLVDL